MTSITNFDGDPRIFLSRDGSSIEFEGGQPVLDPGWENFVITSLFTMPGWAGNDLFQEAEEQYGSDFEEAVNAPITVNSIENVRQAALAALQNPVFETIDVTVTNPSSYKLRVKIQIQPVGQDIQTITLDRNGLNWSYQATNPAHRRG